MVDNGFKTYEEYIDGALKIGETNRLVLSFWSQPPAHWTEKYGAAIEEIKKHKSACGVKIAGENNIKKFISNEMPAFEGYIDAAKEQLGESDGVLRLAKQLLFDSESQRKQRLSEFRK